MKLKFQNLSITIDDNCEEAKKIKEGYSYTIKNGIIKIGKIEAKITNKYQIMLAIKKAKTLEELKVILIQYINIK